MGNIHEEKAVEYYANNFNCSQGVFTTYAVEHGIDEKLALRIATNFGGGARKGEMCGAVSGALMVLGLLYGHSESSDNETKSTAYAMAEEYMNRFISRNGSVVCRELLGYDLSKPDERERIMEKNLFRTFCPEMIRNAVSILDELLEDYRKING
jgi:C_GCAxxG_C_C family probable redox protein